MHERPVRPSAVTAVVTALTLDPAGAFTGGPAEAREPTGRRSGPSLRSGPVTAPPKTPTAVGFGGAVTSADPHATRIGLKVLRHGGNAVDAAIATAAAWA